MAKKHFEIQSFPKSLTISPNSMEKALNVQKKVQLFSNEKRNTFPFHHKLKIRKNLCKVCNFMVVNSISLKRFHKDTSKEFTRIMGLSECWKVLYCVFRLQIFPENLLFVKLVEWEAEKFHCSFIPPLFCRSMSDKAKLMFDNFSSRKNEIFQFKYF